MMFRLVPILVLTCLPLSASAKFTDLSCDDSSRLNQTLTEVIGAERQGIGVRDPETLIEVWIKERSGEWLIVQNYANGTSCIVAIGEHWENLAPSPA